MINQVTVEALHSANYVENYLDSVENLPDDVQRHLSRIREIDVLYRNHLRDVSIYYEQWNGAQGSVGANGVGGSAGSDSSSTAATPVGTGVGADQPSQASKRAMVRMQQGLISAQELGDEKLQIVQHLQDLIDHKTRQLDQDFKNLGSDFFSRLDYGRETEKLSEPKEIRTSSHSPGSTSSPNNAASAVAAISSPSSAFGAGGATGNGPTGVAGGGAGSGSGGNGTEAVHNSSEVFVAANSGSSAANNGNGGNGSGASGPGSVGGAGGGGSGSGGNGGGAGNERGSKRARRTRNDQSGGSGANNGSSTPNSTSGAMDVDPIDTSNIKQEVDAPGGVGGGASGSGSNSGKAASGSGSGAAGGGSGSGGSGGAGSGQGASGGAQGKKGGAAAGGKKKKRKAGGRGQAREAREDTPPPEETIDPDEPTYCLCDQISFGEMILCDNDLCPIEWFHFSCVALMSKPKGKWFCPNCRGDRPNVMKPKAQFLKELERYNKEKEEKT